MIKKLFLTIFFFQYTEFFQKNELYFTSCHLKNFVLTVGKNEIREQTDRQFKKWIDEGIADVALGVLLIDKVEHHLFIYFFFFCFINLLH